MRDEKRFLNNRGGSQYDRGGRHRQYGGDRQTRAKGGFQQPESMESAIPSPYNFVPLAETVSVDDEWAEKISHDIPFSDGISGVLSLQLTAESPIYIRNGGTHPDDQNIKLRDQDYLDFYRLSPKGPYGIPGSSLKGMIRNVVEIASFSKMALVDNYKYSIRDLNNQKHYTGRLTESVSGAYKPKARAGWLEDRGDGEWVLYPCKYGRVDQRELARYHGKGFTPWDRQSAIKKYKQWLDAQTLEIRCKIGPETRHSHGKGAFIYHKVDQLGSGPDTGVIVLTGQPAGWSPDRPGSNKRKKHMEFVFFNTSTTPVPIAQKLKDEFIFVHSESSGVPNEEWKYWKKKMQKGERVPVFFLGNPQSPDSMGLAMMYRLAYQFSVIDAIRHTSDDHCDSDRLDFAQCLFGRVEKKSALRSRVWFRPMIIDEKNNPTTEPKITTILNNPKPTYYPNYVEQYNNMQGIVQGDYQTFMDDTCRIRGWKRYPTRIQDPSPIQPSEDQNKVSTAFRPLPKGTIFNGYITIHNLRPAELGALVWAIRLGDRPGARHSLGMAKPYGFGQVTLRIEHVDLLSNDNVSVDLEQCVARFKEKMNEYCAGLEWDNTPQIQALLDMADPGAHRPHKLKYPVLGRGRGNNQFEEYKKQRMALPGFVSQPVVSNVKGKTPSESRGGAQSGGGQLDILLDRAAGQPLILADLKNAPAELQKWIESQDKEELTKQLLVKFIKKYPDHIKRWKAKYEKQQKGILVQLKPLIDKFGIEIPD